MKKKVRDIKVGDKITFNSRCVPLEVCEIKPDPIEKGWLSFFSKGSEIGSADKDSSVRRYGWAPGFYAYFVDISGEACGEEELRDEAV
jgi:hypothetical protein